MEHIVKEQLEDQLDYSEALDDRQFGFQKSCSTTQLLTVNVNDWILARDQGQTTAVVYIDLSKAFDQVRHQRLLLSLHAAGVGGKALSWFVRLPLRPLPVCCHTV